jgi:hypothetical protein
MTIRKLLDMNRLLISLILLLCITRLALGDFVVTFVPKEDGQDTRADFAFKLLQLSLDKTRPEYGDYRLERLPPSMNLTRAIYELKRNTYENFYILGGMDMVHENDKNLDYVDFPIDMGMHSYRVCFASEKSREKVAKVRTLHDVKKLTIGQGTNWPDVEILRHNGIKVFEVPVYTSLFKLLAVGRIDLFCRGITELQNEYQVYGNKGHFFVEESFVLHYPMPWVLFLNKKSVLAKQRIEAGLKLAVEDGSVEKLFELYNRDAISFAAMKARKVIKLENPFPYSPSATYQSYLLDPFSFD